MVEVNMEEGPFLHEKEQPTMSRSLHISLLVLLSVCWTMTNSCPCNDKYKDISPLPDVFESSELPTEDCCLPSVGNGYLATVVYSDTIYMNGVYNGRGGTSHRARIPSPTAVKIVPPSIEKTKKESYLLDIRNGTFHHKISLSGAEIDQRMYAHQNISNLLVNEIVVTRKASSSGPITLRLVHNSGPKSTDIDFKEVPAYQGTRMMYGSTVVSETVTSPTISVAVNWTVVPDNITLSADANSKTWAFITAIGPNSTVAARFQALGLQLAAAGVLYSEHCNSWQSKWNSGSIEVDNLTLSKAIYGSLYYIMSSLPSLNYDNQEFPFHYFGLSPGGLAHGSLLKDYQGHVFWDQETWMYPTIMMLHPKLGRAMLESRTHHVDAAKNLSKSRGYEGAEYPWEMAYSGAEVCPDKRYSLQEIHINGDISFAVQQYLYMTEDVDFLKNNRGFEMVSELAKYWASRAVYNSTTGNFDINGVKPPDEYQSKVKNSVYTNAVAQINLRLPTYAGKLVNTTVPQSWTKMADKLFMPFDASLNYHPEFEGYKIGTKVKQADAILLGFPLNVSMDIGTRLQDLLRYEPVTDPNGPAMSWSMFSIGFGDVLKQDERDQMFDRSFQYIRAPYRVWTEESSGEGAVNFITGMGGFLQSVLFGYGGFRIDEDHLLFQFNLPRGTRKFSVKGLDYRGSELTFVAMETTVSVTMTSQQEGAPRLRMTTATGVTNDLVKGKTVVIHRLSWATIEAVP